MHSDPTSYPRPSRPGTVWVVAPDSDTDRPGLTGIHHADVECPVLRTWVEREPSRAQLVEVDPTAGRSVVAWECDWDNPDGWEYYPDRYAFDLNEWRPCQRCGSVPDPAVAACPRCFLIGCDCEG